MSLEGLLVLLLSFLLFGALAQSFRFRKGRSVSKGYRTKRMLRIRAVAGNCDARYRLGVRCLERNNDAAGFRWLMKSAKGGNVAAQDAVGMMYEHGRGVSRDYGEAAKWYEKAADRGFADSEVNLGNLYALGRGVERDYGQAVKWLEEAASKGSRQARNSLAWLLATCPDSTIRNGKRAVDILRPVVNCGERHPILLDTLAAAFAEAGHFDAALRLVGEAITKSDPATDKGLYGQMKRHKAFYETGKPWREPQQEEAAGEDRVKPETATIEAPTVATTEEATVDDEPNKTETTACPDRHEYAGGEDQGPKEVEGVPEEQEAQPSLPSAGSLDDSGGPSVEEGPATPAHVDYIVEKLLVIEQLLRPLKAGEHEPPEQTPPNGMTVSVNESGGLPADNASISPAMSENEDKIRTALQLADDFAKAVVKGDYKEVYARMDAAFRAAVPEDQMGPMLQQMFDAYGGRPTEAELQAKDTGYGLREGAGVAVNKFWYALQGSRYDMGDFVLFLEMVPDKEGFLCSSFFILPGKKPQEG